MANEMIVIDVVSEYKDNASSGMENTGRQADKARKKMEDAGKSMDKLGKKRVTPKIGVDDQATPKFKKVIGTGKSFAGKTYKAAVAIDDKVTSKLSSIKNKMFSVKSAIAATGAGFVVGGFISSSVKTYAEFSSKMSEVKAISGATGKEFDVLSNKAKKLGTTTKFTATEAAEGMKYMGMAGWSAKDIKKGIGGVLNLAAASGEDLGSVSDIVTDAMTAFGMGASQSNKFADILAQASAKSNTNVGLMGESFKYVAATAGALKYSAEDTSIALGLMANAGIKGSMAGTSLKTSLANLAAPTDKMQGVMNKYGISLTDSNGKVKNLKQVMDNLRSSLGDLSETEKTAAASTLFGKDALSGMLSIVNASEKDYKSLTKSIYNSDGASKKMADTMMDNLTGSWTRFASAVDGVKNTLGEKISPYLIDVLKHGTDLMPELQSEIAKTMDKFDKFYNDSKAKLKGIMQTDDWKDASSIGEKINVAWDELISNPFSDWWDSTGKPAIVSKLKIIGTEAGKSIKDMFKNSLKDLLPGGDKAGIEDYIIGYLGLKGGLKLFGKGKNLLDNIFGTGVGNPLSDSGVGTMTVTAATVYVNGGLSGGNIPGTPGNGTDGGTGNGNTVQRVKGGLFGLGGKGITLKSGETVAATGAKAWFGNLGVKLGSAATTAGSAATVGVAGAAGAVGTVAGIASAVGNIYKAVTSKNKEEKKKEGYRGGTKLGMVGAGAATGAAIGSVVPVVGTAAGALIGGGIGGLTALFKGNEFGDHIRKNMDKLKSDQKNKLNSYSYDTDAIQESGQKTRKGLKNFALSNDWISKRTSNLQSDKKDKIHSYSYDIDAIQGKSGKGVDDKLSDTTKKATRETKSYTKESESASKTVKSYGATTSGAASKVSGLGSYSSTAGGNVGIMGGQALTAGGNVSALGMQATLVASVLASAAATIRSAAAQAKSAAAGKTPNTKLTPPMAVKKNARGNYIGSHIVSELGEEGPEMVIPLSNHRNRALKLWEQAGNILGVRRYARGGIAGQGSIQGTGRTSSGGVQVNVASGAIQITVQAGGSDDVVTAIRSGRKEITDAILNAIVDACGTSYTNRTAEAM